MTKVIEWGKEKCILGRKRKWQSLISAVLGVSLALFYGYHISSLHTLWELGDEAGYLWNAAYLTGTDWDSFAGAYSYYGYGYSILLIPLFWFTSNGIQLVRCVYVINVLCVLGMYVVLIKLLKEMAKKPSSLSIPIIAFISSLAPYITSNTIKVLCEVFLSFWYSLLVLLLFLALKKQKRIYTFFLGICGAFIFFIHTRAIVVAGALGLILLLNALRKKGKCAKNFIISIILMGAIFGLLYLIKVRIVDYERAARQIAGMDTEVGNIVTLSALSSTLKWLDPVNCICGLFGKIFYTVYATGAVLLPGFLCMSKQVYAYWKASDRTDSDYAVSSVIVFVEITYFLMLIALVFMGTGSDLRYALYGRYYEYMLPIILSLCTHFFIEANENISVKEMFICLVCIICIGIVTHIWCVSSLPNQSVTLDTMRLAALSKVIVLNDSLGSVIDFVILVCGIHMLCFIVVYRKKYSKWIVLPMIFISLWVNSSACLDEIHAIHDRTIGDTEIAEYLIKNTDSQKIYMIDDNTFRFQFYYSKIQIYLKDKVLYIIDPEQSESIEKDSYVIVYSSTVLKDSILSEYQFLMEGPTFLLYQK